MSLEKKIKDSQENLIEKYYDSNYYKTKEVEITTKFGYTIGLILTGEGLLIALGLLANKGCQYIAYIGSN